MNSEGTTHDLNFYRLCLRGRCFYGGAWSTTRTRSCLTLSTPRTTETQLPAWKRHQSAHSNPRAAASVITREQVLILHRHERPGRVLDELLSWLHFVTFESRARGTEELPRGSRPDTFGSTEPHTGGVPPHPASH